MKWITDNTSSLAGKTVAVSGATGGIGCELCEFLARLGARIVTLDRNREKSDNLKEKLLSRYPDACIEQITLDLEDITSVKHAADKLEEMPIDYLILNAGAYHIPRHKCSTGLDNVFQINFVSPYYLARRLMPKITERNGRVVAVGSIAHNYSHIDTNDIDFSTYKQSSKAYGNSKRFLMFSLYGFFEGTDVLSVTHPGITFTNITAHYPKLIFALIKHPMKVIFMKPKKACLSILYGMFQSCSTYEWIGPRLFNVWGLPKKQKLRTCGEAELRQICSIAEEIYRKTEV